MARSSAEAAAVQALKSSIQEEEDDLVMRQLSDSGRSVLVRRAGGGFCVLSLWDGEEEGSVASRHALTVLARGERSSLDGEADRLNSVSFVMES